MAFRDAFSKAYADEMMGQYDCPDRLVFLAYNQYLQSGAVSGCSGAICSATTPG